MSVKTLSACCAIVLGLAASAVAQGALQLSQDGNGTTPPGARVFIGPIEGGYDNYLAAAMHKKQVPVVVVETREEAEFEIKGSAESQKASAAKKIIMGNWQSDEQASISV